MKALLLSLVLSAAPVFATQLNCNCTAPNFDEKMTCGAFDEGGECRFEAQMANNVVWVKQFLPAGNGIVFKWSTNGQNEQTALIQPKVPFHFNYYGDNQTFEMNCFFENSF